MKTTSLGVLNHQCEPRPHANHDPTNHDPRGAEPPGEGMFCIVGNYGTGTAAGRRVGSTDEPRWCGGNTGSGLYRHKCQFQSGSDHTELHRNREPYGMAEGRLM